MNTSFVDKETTDNLVLPDLPVLHASPPATRLAAQLVPVNWPARYANRRLAVQPVNQRRSTSQPVRSAGQPGNRVGQLHSTYLSLSYSPFGSCLQMTFFWTMTPTVARRLSTMTEQPLMLTVVNPKGGGLSQHIIYVYTVAAYIFHHMCGFFATIRVH